MTRVVDGARQIAIILLALAIAVGLIVLALWVGLPFGVFGTKPLLRRAGCSPRETNRKLEEIRRLIAELGPQAAPALTLTQRALLAASTAAQRAVHTGPENRPLRKGGER